MKPTPTDGPSVLSPVRVVAWVSGVAIAGLLLVLFVLAVPDAVQRTMMGALRPSQAACEVLTPTPTSPVLGTFPVAAPAFALKDFTGRELSLSSLRGTVVLVNFWATWCATCAVEMPSMEKLVTRMRGKPFRLLAISVDDGWPEIRKFFEAGTPLEILLDTPKAVAKQFGTEKFPESFLIDKRGQVRAFIVSDRDWSKPDVEACIESLMAE